MESYIAKTQHYQNWTLTTPRDQHNTQSYAAYYARVYHFLICIEVLNADFIEKEGLILLKSNIPEDWVQFSEEATVARWSKKDIEYAINHIHIRDLFMNDQDIDDTPNEVLEFIAETIAKMWGFKLNVLFPNKIFEIEVTDRDWNPQVYAVEA